MAIIKQLTLIGVGLIGGSLARALRASGQVQEVIGFGRNLANLHQAVDLGVVDRIETSMARAVRGADMLVLAVPVGAMAQVLGDIAPHISDQTVITDVGSVKGSIVAAARAALGVHFHHFVPAHPLAGSEKSGVTASVEALFRGQRVILTPVAETDGGALTRVEHMWRATGAETVTLSVEEHDAILAATSHLPHLLAFSLIDVLAREPATRRVFDFIGNGFRDMTRIAASDPVMWRDIGLANRTAILQALGDYRADLDALIAALEHSDAVYLEAFFTRARQARQGIDPK